MSVWSWSDIDWGPGGAPEWIKTRMTPVGKRQKELADGKPAKDTRPKKRRFRLTAEGEKKAVAALSQGQSVPDVAQDLRVPASLVETASRRAGPHDCAYGCGPTRTAPIGRAVADEDRVRQRVQCGCPKARRWTRITVRESE